MVMRVKLDRRSKRQFSHRAMLGLAVVITDDGFQGAFFLTPLFCFSFSTIFFCWISFEMVSWFSEVFIYLLGQ
jgi:hypothetical protein